MNLSTPLLAGTKPTPEVKNGHLRTALPSDAVSRFHRLRLPCALCAWDKPRALNGAPCPLGGSYRLWESRREVQNEESPLAF